MSREGAKEEEDNNNTKEREGKRGNKNRALQPGCSLHFFPYIV